MNKSRIGAGLLGLVACAGLGLAAAPASAAPTVSKGTVISVGRTAYGSTVVVGSGPYKGFSLYMLTSDHGTHFGCKSYTVKTPVGPILCTGPSNDRNAEWPAITTKGAPVAGKGINASLLGTVKRKFGTQVTYAGHPLYLFDQGPGQVTGMGWDEPSLPPWHGVWNLLKPNGQPLWWEGQLTTVRRHHQTVLAARMFTGVGWISFPVYTRSVPCTGSCARVWPYMLSAGQPGTSRGVDSADLGRVWTAQGWQITYRGAPLFYYANETLNPANLTATGNGAGVDGFSLVGP